MHSTRIEGDLHAEVTGAEDRRRMLFVHPNPMDSSCWIHQLMHFATWYRCIAVDLPGYGRSPRARNGLTMGDIAAACWETVDRCGDSDEAAVLVGSSVGSTVVQHMYHQRPEMTDAIVLSGAGWHQRKAFAGRRISAFLERGIAYRREYCLEDFSPAFRRTPKARWLADLLVERNGSADLATIVHMFRALGQPDPPGLQGDLRSPVLIVNGGEDPVHIAAGDALAERLPHVTTMVIEGAGHACHFEDPAAYDRAVIDFLRDNGHNLGLVK